MTRAEADITGLRSVRAWLGRHRDDLVADVVRLARAETPSDDQELLTAGLADIEVWLRDQLGEPTHRVHHRSADHGDAVVLDHAGQGDRPVVCLAHYDTVFPRGTLTDWPVEVTEETITGPGVFDMKGGLVQLVWAIRALREHGLPHPPLRLVLTGDEEIGSPFSRPVIEAAGHGTQAALVFEPAAESGAFKTTRKGIGLFTVEVTGVESHAGLDPESGVSAISELAGLITHLDRQARPELGTTINVGTVRGGGRTNVLAGYAAADLDVRVSTPAEQTRVEHVLAALSTQDARAHVRATGGWNRPPMTPTDGSRWLVSLAALGVPVLDGFGARGGGAHARHEHLSVPGLVDGAALAAGVIAALAPR